MSAPDDLVAAELRKLPDDSLSFVAVEAERRCDRATSEGDDMKAELFTDVAHRAATELAQRAELRMIRGIVSDMRAILTLAGE